MMHHADPVGLPGLAALMLGLMLFLAALLAAKARAGIEPRGNATRSRQSMIGIAVQTLAISGASFGVQRVTLDPLSAEALVEAAAILALMGGATALFFWASRTMGRNWSIVARTRDDHALVENGPFAYLRHPIYVAILCILLAVAIASGHTTRLLLCVPLYGIGTWLRIQEEERLLRTMFGPAYDAYAARVKRFVPGIW